MKLWKHLFNDLDEARGAGFYQRLFHLLPLKTRKQFEHCQHLLSNSQWKLSFSANKDESTRILKELNKALPKLGYKARLSTISEDGYLEFITSSNGT